MRKFFRAVLGLAALVLLVALVGGCSWLVDFSECSETAECVAEHGQGWSCSSEGLCQHSGPALCQSSAECVSKHGDGWVCHEGSCEQPELLVAPCDRKEGPLENANAFRIGVVLQLSGSGAGFGAPMLDAIILAQEDINGINGVNGRPIALIVCDTQGNNERAKNAANHLVGVAGVQAIIGFNSSQVLEVATEVTIPQKVLLVSPSATATTISFLDDDGLVWRTAPSDAIQGQAMGQLVSYAIDDVIDSSARAGLKIAVLVRQNDRYATGLRETVVPHLPGDIVNDSARFSARDYPNIGAGQPGDYTGVISALASEAVEPDVVVILGSGEAWEIAQGLDSVLAEKQPLYFVGDAVKNAALAAKAPSSLEGRIWGTAPQNVGDRAYPPYLSFRVKYQARYGQDPNPFQFVANAFDALYVVAFAAAAEGFTGEEMARGMKRLSGGEAISPRPDDAQKAMQTLRSGGSIDYMGASGPLDFDANGDPQSSPIALWCFQGGNVPEKGVILDDDLDFTPLSCAGQ
ncbi:MAG: ABC transporter substrate-binding protein [Bradymonadaceae bacterium]|nr:ABC transporter substrate-binding protein [Lujinxingiaceae bacterium]